MIKIICVGKLKEKYLKDASEEYFKRLSRYTKLELIELEDCSIDDEVQALNKEKDLIKSKIDDKDFVITTEIESNQLTSVELSNKIDFLLTNGNNIVFIVGGSHGLHPDIKQRADYKLSFSKMTFPHQLFRILLLEQIYRAFKIIKNEKYHK